MKSSTNTDSEISLYTVGHSNVLIAAFIALLSQFKIESLVDVRSQPFSRFSPQFTRKALEISLSSAGIEYLFMGQSLGGRPTDESLYTPQGHVDYAAVAASPTFITGIERLVNLASSKRIAIMCAEADFKRCHRYKLITPALIARGIEVVHIRHSGEVAHTDPSDFEIQQRNLF